MAPSTIERYEAWIADFLRFCRQDGQWRHPRDLYAREVEGFLTHLARWPAVAVRSPLDGLVEMRQ